MFWLTVCVCVCNIGLMSCGETSRKPIPQQNLSVGNLSGSYWIMSLLFTVIVSVLHH